MEAGLIVDHGYGMAYQAAWVAGAVEWSRWRGLKAERTTEAACDHLSLPAMWTPRIVRPVGSVARIGPLVKSGTFYTIVIT